MEMFTRLILYIRSLIKLIKIYIIDLFDLQSSLVNENNGYFQIWGHVKRVYNNHSDDAKNLSRTSCFTEYGSGHVRNAGIPRQRYTAWGFYNL